MHLSGFDVSFYWAIFPTEYLRAVRNGSLRNRHDIGHVTIRHSEPRSLLKPDERDQVIAEFIALIRCIANGDGNVGFIRRDSDSPIHRKRKLDEMQGGSSIM
jgi:hypothetical protein